MSPTVDPRASAAQAVIEALEQLTFLAAEWQGQGEWLPDPRSLWAAVPVRGGAGFDRFTMVMPELLARRMAGAVLGKEPESVGEGELVDVIRETANTACGTLARFLGSQAGYALCLPEAGRGAPPLQGQLLADEMLDVEGQPLQVKVERT